MIPDSAVRVFVATMAFVAVLVGAAIVGGVWVLVG